MSLRTTTLVVLAASLALPMLAAPIANAQILNAQVGGFGTQVKVGDADYVPLLKGTSRPIVVGQVNVGSGTLSENCLFMLFDGGVGNTPTLPVTPARPGPTYSPFKKDIRLVPCMGKDGGVALSDTDVAERNLVLTTVAMTTQYVDLNGNGKYDKGDYVYLTTNACGSGLAASTGPTVFTVRLTPVSFAGQPILLGGLYAKASDADFTAYKAVALCAQPNSSSGAAPLVLTVVEREDKGWYLVPVAASTSMSNLPLPVNSIRVVTEPLATANIFTLQPSVIATDASLANPSAASVGQPLPIIATILNSGASFGPGVLVTKLDGQIVDVRLTPILNPTEITKVLIIVPAPLVTHGGTIKLEVNDVVAAITIDGSSAAAAGDISGLQTQVTQLQARLVALEANRGAPVAVSKGSASLAPLALMGVLALGALGLRRRTA